jgi:hypothetical protein
MENKIENKQKIISLELNERVPSSKELISSLLPPILNLSPALEPEKSVKILKEVEQDSFNLSQNVSLESMTLSDNRRRASLELSPTGFSAAKPILNIKSAEEFESCLKGGSASYSHRDLRFESDLDFEQHSNSFNESTSGFIVKKNQNRIHSGGSGGTIGAKRGTWRSQKGDSCSLSSRNSEDDEGLDEIIDTSNSNPLPSSFLSTASLPLTPFKNQVLSILLKYVIIRSEAMLLFCGFLKKHFVNRWT